MFFVTNNAEWLVEYLFQYMYCIDNKGLRSKILDNTRINTRIIKGVNPIICRRYTISIKDSIYKVTNIP